MLEARLDRAEILKKVLDAVKELVTDANFDCSDDGIKLQAMDNSHVALVSLHLAAAGFAEYRCDRDMSLGMSLQSLQKIIKCAGNEDVVTLRADESHDVLGLLFEDKKAARMGEYEMKLMDIDQEHLGIPDTVYDAEIKLPATEFARIIRDLKELGESVKIEVSKEGVRFSADGDIGSASVTLKPTDGKDRNAGSDAEEDDEEDSDEEEEEEQEEEEEEAQDNEEEEEEVAAEVKDEDDDVVIADEKPKIPADDNDEEMKPATATAGDDQEADEKPASAAKLEAIEVNSDDDEDEEGAAFAAKVKSENKRKAADKQADKDKAKKIKLEKQQATKDKAAAAKKKKAAEAAKKKAAAAAKAASKGKGKASAAGAEAPKEVKINLQQGVALTFSIKYLSNFAKSTPLSDHVLLHMSNEVPLLVEYPFEAGHIRYYLAPKIADGDE